MIQLGHVYSVVRLEGPARALLDSWTTFVDEETQQVHSFIDGKGQIYTGLLLYLDPYLTSYLSLPSVRQAYTSHYEPDKVSLTPSDYLEGITLRDYQIEAVSHALCANRGILELATGAGKTEIACAIIKRLFYDRIIQSSVVVTATQYLMDQFYQRAVERLAGSGITIGRVGEGYKDTGKHVLVGVIDSLYIAVRANNEIGQFVQTAGCMIIDEMHHLRARSWEAVGQACTARFRYGLTPKVRENLHGITPDEYRTIGLTGPVVYQVPACALVQQGYLAKPHICMLEVNHPQVAGGSWHVTYRRGVVEHGLRNALLINCTAKMYTMEHKVLVLVTQLKHGYQFVQALAQLGYPAVFAHGGNKLDYLTGSGWKRETVKSSDLKVRLAKYPSFILVGSVILDEGFDLPEISCVVMASGYKKFRRIIQRLGRGMRPKDGENRVYIFDCLDRHNNTLFRHSSERVMIYRSEGHQVSYGLEDLRRILGVPFELNMQVQWDCGKKRNRSC